MAAGKSKKMIKKGGKKKTVDPFSRKEWYDVKAPGLFKTRQVGKTLVNRTQGTRISSDFLKGRIYEISLGDLNSIDTDFKKFRLVCEDVQGRECLTNFHGMRFTRDKLCSIIRKWHTLIEATTLVRTSDGYLLRVFSIGFTKRDPQQVRKTTYAQASQVRAIRARMVEIMQAEVQGVDLKTVVQKLIAGSIEKEIERKVASIYPLQDVYVNKVKVIKKPKLDHGRLLDLHGGESATVVAANGEVISRPDDYEPPTVESV